MVFVFQESSGGETRTHARSDLVVHGSWVGGVSVRVRRASEARECVMSTEYERCLNNESREQSQSHPGLGGGDPRGGMSVVPTRGSQVECLATCSEYEDKTIDEAYTSSVDALTGGLTPRLGRCEQEDTEGWKDARVSGRGGETPLETRRKVRRGDGGVAREAGEDGVHAVGAREVNSIPAGVHEDTEPELLCEPHEMRKTSATEGRLRNPPEPWYDGATHDLRVRDAVHIVPPDVADVVSVANAGSVQGTPGPKRCIVNVKSVGLHTSVTFERQCVPPKSQWQSNGGLAPIQNPMNLQRYAWPIIQYSRLCV